MVLRDSCLDNIKDKRSLKTSWGFCIYSSKTFTCRASKYPYLHDQFLYITSAYRPFLNICGLHFHTASITYWYLSLGCTQHRILENSAMPGGLKYIQGAPSQTKKWNSGSCKGSTLPKQLVEIRVHMLPCATCLYVYVHICCVNVTYIRMWYQQKLLVYIRTIWAMALHNTSQQAITIT